MNDVLSSKNGHKKAPRTFQFMIYNDLIDFFICKQKFSVSAFALDHYYVAITTRNNCQCDFETDKRHISC